MNTLYLEALTLEVLFRYTFLSRQHKRSMYVFIGLHCLPPEAATRVEVFCKKSILKNFVNFIGKHLCWSLLNKVAGLSPILKNICQRLLLHYTRTTHCYLSVLLYIQHIPPQHHCYQCWYIRCLFLVQIKKASKNLNLVSRFHWSHFHRCYFPFHIFSVFLSFVLFFLVTVHKKDSFKLRID